MLPLTAGSLFSGIGGLDLGLERADVDAVAALGNAVVPQVAEWIGARLRALAEASDE